MSASYLELKDTTDTDMSASYLEIKDTTDTDLSVLFLDLYLNLEIDSEGLLKTKLYDKRDDFNFPIVNFH